MTTMPDYRKCSVELLKGRGWGAVIVSCLHVDEIVCKCWRKFLARGNQWYYGQTHVWIAGWNVFTGRYLKHKSKYITEAHTRFFRPFNSTIKLMSIFWSPQTCMCASTGTNSLLSGCRADIHRYYFLSLCWHEMLNITTIFLTKLFQFGTRVKFSSSEDSSVVGNSRFCSVSW